MSPDQSPEIKNIHLKLASLELAAESSGGPKSPPVNISADLLHTKKILAGSDEDLAESLTYFRDRFKDSIAPSIGKPAVILFSDGFVIDTLIGLSNRKINIHQAISRFCINGNHVIDRMEKTGWNILLAIGIFIIGFLVRLNGIDATQHKIALILILGALSFVGFGIYQLIGYRRFLRSTPLKWYIKYCVINETKESRDVCLDRMRLFFGNVILDYLCKSHIGYIPKSQ